MPYQTKRQCPGRGLRHGFCQNLINSEICCPECQRYEKAIAKEYDHRRGNSNERGYDATWQKLRRMKAARNPLCERHFAQGVYIPLDVVHHIKPIETHPELRLAMDNLMSLCNACHEEIHKGERWGR
jgi:5-methylcytosine-specific restriction protein A